MRISFTEPVFSRYIHINPVTNKVHLLVPIVAGQTIGTDNTCKTWFELKKFFDGSALEELNTYKEALVFDIALLAADDTQRADKEARLAQIEVYIEAVSSLSSRYGAAMTAFLDRPSNLYSVQLRPRAQDFASRVINPAFNVNRTNDATGTPLSPLYNEMHSVFPTLAVPPDPSNRLKTAVLRTTPASASFADIQTALGEQSLALLGVTINFTQTPEGTTVTKEMVDALMGFGADTSQEEYTDALLGICARFVLETLPTPPFYSIPARRPEDTSDVSTERLSILTQFFLANLNVHCKARSLSGQNFGVILDASPELCHSLVSLISTTLTRGEDVEKAICTFFNDNAEAFGLSRPLNEDDVTSIRQTFEGNYRTVTATPEDNPHMDDFMVLDKEAIGETAKCVTHQGSICVNFAEIIDPIAASSNPGYFASVRTDFAAHPAEVPPRNESMAGEVEIDVETLLTRISDEQFDKLPTAVKEACHAHPSFHLVGFLNNTAKGKQDEAAALLTRTPDSTQSLLRTPGVFTDYSGRTFNCTAYEYAYWAKDTHMCRMLESHMDEETKALMLARIDIIEESGLSYRQNGVEHCSPHFDLTPLRTALQTYADGFNGWWEGSHLAQLKAAWMNVAKMQRDVPAHIAQEYCRPGRPFHPRPEFDEPELPRHLLFDNVSTSRDESWFPLAASNIGLGFDFGILRFNQQEKGKAVGGSHGAGARSDRFARMDIEALNHLDTVRTADLLDSRQNLNPPAVALHMPM